MSMLLCAVLCMRIYYHLHWKSFFTVSTVLLCVISAIPFSFLIFFFFFYFSYFHHMAYIKEVYLFDCFCCVCFFFDSVFNFTFITSIEMYCVICKFICSIMLFNLFGMDSFSKIFISIHEFVCECYIRKMPISQPYT